MTKKRPAKDRTPTKLRSRAPPKVNFRVSPISRSQVIFALCPNRAKDCFPSWPPPTTTPSPAYTPRIRWLKRALTSAIHRAGSSSLLNSSLIIPVIRVKCQNSSASVCSLSVHLLAEILSTQHQTSIHAMADFACQVTIHFTEKGSHGVGPEKGVGCNFRKGVPLGGENPSSPKLSIN